MSEPVESGKSAQGSDESLPSRSSSSRTLEAAVVVPNVILLGLIVLYLVVSRGSGPRVKTLVKTDRHTTATIKKLEEMLRRDPRHVSAAIKLAKLYMRAGEYPWSVDALRSAERHGSSAPEWRMKLGLAYLELGRNLDGLRVLKGALLGCSKRKCAAHVEARLRIFTRVAELLQRRGINARTHQAAAAKMFSKVLRKVEPARLSRLKRQALRAAAKARAAAKGSGTAASPGSGSAASPGSGSAASPGSGSTAGPGSGSASSAGSGSAKAAKGTASKR